MSFKEDINQHYAGRDFSERINAAFARAGLNINTITSEDIEKFDEFHIRGKDATRDLAKLGKIQPGMHLLDIGCGIGGPSRTFAGELGCKVTGIDITEEYCKLARIFNNITGLSKKIQVEHADATQMPFYDGSFDAAVTEHVTMNIGNKEQLLKEIFRVLRPGGKYCFYEIFSSDESDIYFPVPWAETPNLSFLQTPESFVKNIKSNGFLIEVINDLTQLATQWFKSAADKLTKIVKEGQLTFSLALLMKDNTIEKADNMIRSLDEGKLKVAMGAAVKPL